MGVFSFEQPNFVEYFEDARKGRFIVKVVGIQVRNVTITNAMSECISRFFKLAIVSKQDVMFDR